MELVNETQMSVAWIVGKITPPEFSVTCVVKGTFLLSPGTAATLVEKQLAVTGDVQADDDPEKQLIYPDDFAYWKPRAEALLQGTCHAPGGRPAPVVHVHFRAGNLSKTLAVSGDRRARILRSPTDPEPFTQMPLTYEHAFGGAAYKKNPLGKGRDPIIGPDGEKIHPLPNIETPDGGVQPAGFAPIPSTWPQRMSKTGTFKKRWLKERWPWYPDDFDWSFFNAAPDDQQLAGYWRGDEELYFENMHPTHAQYRSALPGLRVRCCLFEQVRAHRELREVPMQLDTLWVDMDTERLVLVWRGNAPVRSQKLEEIRYLLATTESLSTAPTPTGHFQVILIAALQRAAEADEELEPEEPEDESEPGEGDEEVEAADENMEDETADDIPAESTEDDDALPVPPADGAAAQSPAEEAAADQRDLEDSFRRMGKEPPAALAAVIATSATVTDEDEDESEPDEADDQLPDSEPEPLTVEQVKDRITRRESFAGQDLSGLLLADLDFSDLSFENAIMPDAVLARSNLCGANFSGASMAGADLREAQCQRADFTDADLARANFARADLTGAVLEGAELSKANLRGAQLTRARAAGALLTEADLGGANLEEALLVEADLSGCRLHHANLSRATLTNASLEKAWGWKVRAVEANLEKLKAAGAILVEGCFTRAIGDGSIWEAAQLYGADFTGARLKGAEFSSAYLGGANFCAAELKAAHFDGANLGRTQMIRANLFEASLTQADLTHADLRESNLYGANLCEALTGAVNFEGANRKNLKHTMEET